MKSPKILLLILVLILVHGVVRQFLVIGGAAPNLIVVAVCLAAFRWGAKGGAWSGFLLGLIEDSFASRSFGAHALILLLLGFLLGKIRRVVYDPSPAAVFLLLTLAALIHGELYLLLYYGSGVGDHWQTVFQTVPVEALMTGLVGTPVLLFFGQ